MTDATQALEQKADRSRKRLTGLMDDLQSQMSPGVMLDNALGFSSDGASDVGDSILQQVAKHPLPYLLIAAGIGWLMFSEATEKSQQRTRKQAKPRKQASRRKAPSKRSKTAS
ncbi:MAG: hypothetical protein QOD94_1962 [Alphaproteobacteria bacterium]|nr:hypothetical protein [Alphaproteobacteria bacterium]